MAIGANLPGPDGAPPLATCRRAAASLDGVAGLQLRQISRWYESAPVPPSGQPPYVNGMALLEGDAAPEALLRELQAVEAREGRVRSIANAARTLDLDIIAMDGLVRDRPDPVLPHPRAHERAFVLLPLADIAPDWVHPRFGLGVRALIAALPPQQIRAL